MSSHHQQGWEDQTSQQTVQIASINTKFSQKDQPLGILISSKHSLQPDMIFGWKPKLPSCPLPLKFINKATDQIMKLISNDSRFKIAYEGKKFSNSIQVNSGYDYYWKYRSRYSLNIALIEQSQKQLENQKMHLQIEKCQYKFNSNFQSGNLDKAIRVKPNQYDCFIRSDSNTKGHCNWYYFSINNGNKAGQMKINICNIGKLKNLYSKGMRPYVLEQENSSWTQQACYDVQFVERICRYGSQNKRFQLQFKYFFNKPNQTVFFAYGVPYTFSKLEAFVKQISSDNQEIVKSEKLCQSLGGINLPLLTITNDVNDKNKSQMKKKAILMTARIHPGQSHSSNVIEGFIRQLVSKKQEYHILRENFIFYIIPMLNPDGVIVGNYRTSYSGKDLNRQFKDINKYAFPQIYNLNQFALEIRQRHIKGIEFYMDFHGHSSKKNMFSYGPDHSPKSIYYFKSRVFPKLIEDLNPIFSYKKSIFKISQGKKKTARAHMLWKVRIPMTYTFEVSNGMYQTKQKKDILLDQCILKEAGRSVMQGLYKYARLEMKLPAKLLAERMVPKHIVKKRVVKSSNTIRQKMKTKLKKRTSINLKQMNEENQNQIKSSTINTNEKVKRVFSKNQLQSQDVLENQNEQNENIREFSYLVNQINCIKNDSASEGGSDSESEQEDFSKQQTQKLFTKIQNTKLLKNPKQEKKKLPPRQLKSKSKNKRTSQKSLQSTNVMNEIKQQLKQYKSRQLEDMIKQSKLIRQINQQSCKLLPSTKTFTRTPTNKAEKQLKLGFRSSFNQSKQNFQSEKICRVPITQKNFNIDL